MTGGCAPRSASRSAPRTGCGAASSLRSAARSCSRPTPSTGWPGSPSWSRPRSPARRHGWSCALSPRNRPRFAGWRPPWRGGLRLRKCSPRSPRRPDRSSPARNSRWSAAMTPPTSRRSWEGGRGQAAGSPTFCPVWADGPSARSCLSAMSPHGSIILLVKTAVPPWARRKTAYAAPSAHRSAWRAGRGD